MPQSALLGYHGQECRCHAHIQTYCRMIWNLPACARAASTRLSAPSEPQVTGGAARVRWLGAAYPICAAFTEKPSLLVGALRLLAFWLGTWIGAAHSADEVGAGLMCRLVSCLRDPEAVLCHRPALPQIAETRGTGFVSVIMRQSPFAPVRMQPEGRGAPGSCFLTCDTDGHLRAPPAEPCESRRAAAVRRSAGCSHLRFSARWLRPCRSPQRLACPSMT